MPVSIRFFAAAVALLFVTGCILFHPAESPQNTATSESEPEMSTIIVLKDTQWTVTELNGAPVSGDQVATLEFGVDGRVSGRAFCNQYFAPYTQDSNALQIGDAGTTRMACPDPLMQMESDFVGILGGASSAMVDSDGHLTLKTPEGKSIKARSGV